MEECDVIVRMCGQPSLDHGIRSPTVWALVIGKLKNSPLARGRPEALRQRVQNRHRGNRQAMGLPLLTPGSKDGSCGAAGGRHDDDRGCKPDEYQHIRRDGGRFSHCDLSEECCQSPTAVAEGNACSTLGVQKSCSHARAWKIAHGVHHHVPNAQVAVN